MNIGIYIYQNSEVLDFSGPFEVCSTANRFLEQPHQVLLIGQSTAPVKARGGFTVTPHYSIAEHPPLDVLIVAGGIHDQEMFNQPVINWIARQYTRVNVLASVCTGAFLLAEAGVLSGLKVTTHWQDIANLQARYSDVEVCSDLRWLDQGKIITSAGISAGIDMSLHLIERLYSRQLATQTAKQMEFDWQTN
ncbi:glutamine amidotransferase [Thalassotalea insulae]|uniref:Glutamine amidotransferase n=1 Tax=Thalassotalea insulae TaxID=2056778 RepID=A0ABQ6GW79_9GAMM|nr:DJ-1/PfpI family protein [Thalassotalea insulae]GLX80178.1 glutamine amidotransferase [Thalassotalea insulae]